MIHCFIQNLKRTLSGITVNNVVIQCLFRSATGSGFRSSFAHRSYPSYPPKNFREIVQKGGRRSTKRPPLEIYTAPPHSKNIFSTADCPTCIYSLSLFFIRPPITPPLQSVGYIMSSKATVLCGGFSVVTFFA